MSLDTLKAQLQEHPLVQRLQLWYQSQTSRDQRIVMALVWLIIAALVFLLLFAPMIKTWQTRNADLQSKIKLYETMASNAHRFGKATTTAADQQAPILTVLTRSSREQGVKLDRYEQEGDGIKIWIDNARFDDFIRWAEIIQGKFGIRVSQISVDATANTGIVNVRATVSR